MNPDETESLDLTPAEIAWRALGYPVPERLPRLSVAWHVYRALAWQRTLEWLARQNMPYPPLDALIAQSVRTIRASAPNDGHPLAGWGV